MGDLCLCPWDHHVEREAPSCSVSSVRILWCFFMHSTAVRVTWQPESCAPVLHHAELTKVSLHHWPTLSSQREVQISIQLLSDGQTSLDLLFVSHHPQDVCCRVSCTATPRVALRKLTHDEMWSKENDILRDKLISVGIVFRVSHIRVCSCMTRRRHQRHVVHSLWCFHHLHPALLLVGREVPRFGSQNFLHRRLDARPRNGQVSEFLRERVQDYHVNLEQAAFHCSHCVRLVTRRQSRHPSRTTAVPSSKSKGHHATFHETSMKITFKTWLASCKNCILDIMTLRSSTLNSTSSSSTHSDVIVRSTECKNNWSPAVRFLQINDRFRFPSETKWCVSWGCVARRVRVEVLKKEISSFAFICRSKLTKQNVLYVRHEGTIWTRIHRDDVSHSDDPFHTYEMTIGGVTADQHLRERTWYTPNAWQQYEHISENSFILLVQISTAARRHQYRTYWF